mgnify:CR=1 FL=1
MTITRIQVSNFKSFKKLDLELNNFNVIIGANASGKSNFVDIFDFLRDIVNMDIGTAISRHGGFEYLQHLESNQNENVSFGFTTNNKFKFTLDLEKKGDTGIRKEYSGKKIKYMGIKIFETIYNLSLKFSKEKPGYEIAKESVIFNSNVFELEEDENKINDKGRIKGGKYLKDLEKIGKAQITLSNINGKIKTDLVTEDELPIDVDAIIPNSIIELISSITEESPIVPLLNTPLNGLPVRWLKIFQDVGIYDFEPRSCKKTTQVTGKPGLEENGENIAIILEDILEDEEQSRKFYNLIKDLLPFVEELGVKSFIDKSVIFTLKEKHLTKGFLPATLLSDGTVNIIALVIALYYENIPFMIIEEPERNIHPYLISKLVEMMKEASSKKQIIVTTHSPELLKYASKENIFFISRNKKGFSSIYKPNENEDVKSFIEHDLGIEELYIDNMFDNLLGEQ